MGSRAYTLQTAGEQNTAGSSLATVETPPVPPATCQTKYARLTRADIGRLVKMRDAGMTQAAIAQQLNCTQQTVSTWLQDLTDTTAESKLYLRGQALTMARDIVKKGRAADKVNVLKGIGVLEEHEQKTVTVKVEGFALFGIQPGASQKPTTSVIEGETIPQLADGD